MEPSGLFQNLCHLNPGLTPWALLLDPSGSLNFVPFVTFTVVLGYRESSTDCASQSAGMAVPVAVFCYNPHSCAMRAACSP
jgi:hypothetical protein